MTAFLKQRFRTEQTPKRDIWQFQAVLSRRLLWWASLNIVTGVWFQQRRNKFWRGVGMQSISWGAINALIAIIGSGVAQIRRSNMENLYEESITTKEERNLLRILWVNAGLDVFYIIGGIILAFTRGSTNRLMRGNGWGIVMQGAFLCLFDIIHGIILSSHEETEK